MEINLSVETDSWSKQATPSIEAKSMLYYLQSAGVFECRNDYITDRKDYDTYLLAYTNSGTGLLSYRKKEYVLRKGDCFLIDCKEHQMYKTGPEGRWEFMWIHFNGSNTAAYYHRIYKNSGPVYKLSEKGIVPGNMLQIIGLLKENDINLQFLAAKHIVEILTELVLINDSFNDTKDKKDLNIEKTIVYIEKMHSGCISLDDMARQANISKYYFSRLFKNYTGYSPFEYLKKYRINNAKQLLKLGNSSIAEIACEVGFESPSYFIKTFKESEGVTPKTFRNYWR